MPGSTACVHGGGGGGGGANTRTAWCVQVYGHAFCPGRTCATLGKRIAPIPASPGGQLSDVGDYFPLVGYGRAVDSLIRALCSLQRRFTPSHLHQFHRQLQLLRAVGAPGLGKTTFVSAVWGMVLTRLAQLLEQGLPSGWEGCDMGSIMQLHTRLAHSWAAGPLVFTLDMSHAGVYCTSCLAGTSRTGH
jgi:hypothetical protein